MNVNDVHVLIPDRFGGVSVVSLVDFECRLDEETYEEAITNAAIDSEADPAAMPALFAAVDALNRTGDGDAYWRVR